MIAVTKRSRTKKRTSHLASLSNRVSTAFRSHPALIIKFKNKPSSHNFNLTYNYDVYESEIYINGLASKILKLEKQILSTTDKLTAFDGGTGLGKDSLTSRFAQFNLFQIKETRFIKEIVKTEYKNFLTQLGINDVPVVYGQCWANVLRKGEKIDTHHHAVNNYAYLSGHMCVQTNQTSTYYLTPFYEDVFKSPNKDGKLTMFPSWLKHYTDSVVGNEERITIGFDLYNEDGYEKDVLDEHKKHWERC